MDVPGKGGQGLEENLVAKREDSIYLFSKHRDAAVTATAWYVSALRHLLQHSRWSARRCILLGDNEDKKTSVKRYGTVIYWDDL